MKNLIKIELSRAFKNKYFYIALFLGIALTTWNYIDCVLPYADDIDSIYAKGGFPSNTFNSWIGNKSFSLSYQIFYQALPFLICLPFANSFFCDKQSGYIKNVFIREEKGNYFMAKYISVFLSSGTVAVIPIITNVIFCAMTFPSLVPEESLRLYAMFNTSLWGNIFYSTPFIFVLLYCCFLFLFFGFMATSAISISFFVTNRFVAMASPYIIYLFISTVLSNINCFTSLYSPSAFLQVGARGFNTVSVIIVLLVLAVLTIPSLILLVKKNETY